MQILDDADQGLPIGQPQELLGETSHRPISALLRGGAFMWIGKGEQPRQACDRILPLSIRSCNQIGQLLQFCIGGVISLDRSLCREIDYRRTKRTGAQERRAGQLMNAAWLIDS